MPARWPRGLLAVVGAVVGFHEALNTVGFIAPAAIVTGLPALLSRVALGLIIFGLGFYLARLAARAVRSSGPSNAPMRQAASPPSAELADAAARVLSERLTGER